MKAVIICVGSNFTPLQYSTNNVRSCLSIHIEELTIMQIVKIFSTIYKAKSTKLHAYMPLLHSLRLTKTTPSHPVCLNSYLYLPVQMALYKSQGRSSVIYCSVCCPVDWQLAVNIYRDFIDCICGSSNTVCNSRLQHFTSQKTVMNL